MVLGEMSPLSHRLGAQVPTWTVVIGAGTGGPQALAQLLPQFPSGFAGSLIVVQQMRPGFTRVLVDLLSSTCKLPIYEPEDGQALQAGRILVAPAGSRLTVANVGDPAVPAYSVFLEDNSDSVEHKYSCIDVAMASAAKTFGAKTIGVLLTGLGTDGREGMREIRNAGGIAIAQDEASSVVHNMPSSAIDAGVVHSVLPLWSIADHVAGIVGGEANAIAA